MNNRFNDWPMPAPAPTATGDTREVGIATKQLVFWAIFREYAYNLASDIGMSDFVNAVRSRAPVPEQPPTVEELCGLIRSTTITGKPLLDICPQDYLEAAAKRVASALASHTSAPAKGKDGK